MTSWPCANRAAALRWTAVAPAGAVVLRLRDDAGGHLPRGGRLLPTCLVTAMSALVIPTRIEAAPVGVLAAGGWSLDNPYTIFVVSALIIAGWLAVFALLTAGRDER